LLTEVALFVVKTAPYALTRPLACAIMEPMTETYELLPQFEMQVAPVNPEAEFVNFDVALAAEAILAEEVATQEIVTGAESLLQEEAATAQPEQNENAVEFNMNMIRLLMFLKDEQARNLVASAIAIDAVGQQHGIEELTFSHAAASRQQVAEIETARLLRAREDDDTDE
jgi:hypothetical protein